MIRLFRRLLILSILSLSILFAFAALYFLSLELGKIAALFLLPLLGLAGSFVLFNKNLSWVEFRKPFRDLSSSFVWFLPAILPLGLLVLFLISFWFLPLLVADNSPINVLAVLLLTMIGVFLFLPLLPDYKNEKEGRWEEGGVSYLYELQNYFMMDFHSAYYLHGKKQLEEEELDKYWQTEPREWYRGTRIVGVDELIPIAGPLSVRYRAWLEQIRLSSDKKLPRSRFYARPTWEAHLQLEEEEIRKQERIEQLKSEGKWNEAEEREKARIEKEIEESWELFFKSNPNWKQSTF